MKLRNVIEWREKTSHRRVYPQLFCFHKVQKQAKIKYILLRDTYDKTFLKGNEKHKIKASGFLWEEDRRMKERSVHNLGGRFIHSFILLLCFKTHDMCALNTS